MKYTELDNNLPPEAVIASLLHYPDFWLPQGVIFSRPGEIAAIHGLRFFYRGVAEWLKHLALGQRLSPECFLSDWRYFQPFAELDKSLWELCKGLYPRTHLNQHFGSPNALWFCVLGLKCKNQVANIGLTGHPRIVGKSEFYAHNLALLKRWSPAGTRLRARLAHGEEEGAIDFGGDPQTYLIGLAADLSGKDSDFDKEYFRPFEKQQSYWTRKIRDCNELAGGVVLPSGELFLTGKGRRIPKEVKRSRFE